jgi:hypothetical protein
VKEASARLEQVTFGEIPPASVLAAAVTHNLTEVVILGYKANGEEYFASSTADIPEQLWLLERFKFVLMHIADEGDAPA